jgi:hypothetical protein
MHQSTDIRQSAKLVIYDRDRRLGEIAWRDGRLVAEPSYLNDLVVWARARADSEFEAYKRLTGMSGHIHAVEC